MRTLAAIFLAGIPALFAQSALTVPGCEARPEVRRVIDQKLSDKALENLKLTDQRKLSYQVLDDLIARYPRELAPYRQLINTTRWDDAEHYPALEERFVKQAEQHPDDPLALYLAALMLAGKDTPRSIELLEKAKSLAPDFAWPNLELAQIHASGKLADKKKAAAEAAQFFRDLPIFYRRNGPMDPKPCRRGRIASPRGSGIARAVGHRDRAQTPGRIRDAVGARIPHASAARA